MSVDRASNLVTLPCLPSRLLAASAMNTRIAKVGEQKPSCVAVTVYARGQLRSHAELPDDKRSECMPCLGGDSGERISLWM